MNQRIGKYEILGTLGQGAMGVVFLARDPVIDRQVAIKTLHPTWAVTPQARERFFREAQAAGRLSHPNIVTILEFGEDAGRLYLVMEYLPGQDLAAAIAERSLPPAVILELLAEVCDGLALAHRNGILHRDIKPSNIRLQAEAGTLRAKIVDFGIARTQSSDLTTSNTLLGTFSYMAPEYIQSGLANPQSDLFAVGVILYEALAGRRPFRADSTVNLFYRILNEVPKPPPAAHLRGISPATLALLQRALAKEPQRRFESAEALAAALRAAKDPAWAGPGAPAGTQVSRRPEWSRRSPYVYALAVGALILLILVGFTLGRRARQVESQARAFLPGTAPVVATRTPAEPPPPPGASPMPETGHPVGAERSVSPGSAPAPAPAPATAASASTPAGAAPASTPAGAAPASTPAGAAPAPAPAGAAPAPRPVADRPAPAPERPSGTLADVAGLVDRDPAAALALLDGIPGAGEDHPRATALRIVALYRLKNYAECADRIRQVADLPRLARESVRLAQVLDQERREHHLSLELPPSQGRPGRGGPPPS